MSVGMSLGIETRMVQRYNMTEECNSIGFFISKFRKVGH